MESACVYEQTTVIHELTQGIQMAKQLRLNLNSAEVRESLIRKILSSYDKALFVLKSGSQPQGSYKLPESSLPKSSISTPSPQSVEFEFGFDQNVVSKKRKLSTRWEDEVRILTDNQLECNPNDGQKDILGASFPRSYNYECSYNKVQKCMATNQVKKTDEHPAPPPPPSPEKHETKPTNHHELSSQNPGETLSNLRANLSVNTWDLSAMFPSSFSYPSTPFGFSDDDFEPLHFPNHLSDELLLQCSPPFISPATSESNYITDWGSSSSLGLLADPVDLYPDFEFNNSFLS